MRKIDVVSIGEVAPTPFGRDNHTTAYPIGDHGTKRQRAPFVFDQDGGPICDLSRGGVCGVDFDEGGSFPFDEFFVVAK